MRRFLYVSLSVALLASACATDRASTDRASTEGTHATNQATDRMRFNSGLPGMTTPAQIVSVHQRGPYLQAHLVLAGRDAQAWSLPTDACQTVFTPGEAIAYRDNGPDGQWVRGDVECQSSGLGPLTLRRDRNTRATPQGIPRSQANYRTIYADADLALLRGVFTEAIWVGFNNSSDLVAVVPRGGECEKPIAEGVASLEYRAKGRDAMSLVGPKGLCPVQAFLIPPGNLETVQEAGQAAKTD